GADESATAPKPIEPFGVDPLDLQRAAQVARTGAELARGAIATALDLEQPDREAGTRHGNQGLDRAALDQAARELAAWQAEQRKALSSMPIVPPATGGGRGVSA